MPFLTTDVAKGQAAGLEMAVAPLRAQEEVNQLPLQTQLLQAKVQGATADIEKSKAELQKTLMGVKDESAARDIVQAYSADPANKDKPVSKKMEELGIRLMGSGLLKDGSRLLDHSDASALKEANVAKAHQDIRDRDMELLHTLLPTLNKDNIDQWQLQAQAAGVSDPKSVARLADMARQARDAGKFDQWLPEVTKETNSFRAKVEEDKMKKAQLAADQAQARIDAGERNAARRSDALIAAISGRDAIATDRLGQEMFKSAEKAWRDSNIGLRETRKERAADLAPPKGGLFSSDEPYKEWEARETERKQREEEFKQSAKEARKDMEKSKSVVSPKTAKLLGDIPSNKELNAPDPTKGKIKGMYEEGKVYEDAKGNKAKYVDGKWVPI